MTLEWANLKRRHSVGNYGVSLMKCIVCFNYWVSEIKYTVTSSTI